METVPNLDFLSEEERRKILSVIKRDESLRVKQNSKIGQIRQEIQTLRQKSVLKAGDDLTKMCARCHEQFGFLFNRGDICPKCKFRVCKMCQEIVFNGSMLCIFCYKQRQLKLLLSQSNQGKFSRRSSGSDLIKASMKLTLVSNGADVSSDNSSARPVSHTHKDGSTSHNGTAFNDRHHSKSESERFPKTSDRRKLTELFDTFKSTGKGNEGSSDQEISVVKQVTSKRYDTDSDSSTSASEDEMPSAPVLSSTVLSSPSLLTERELTSPKVTHSQSENDVGSRKHDTSNSIHGGKYRKHSNDSDHSDEEPFSKSSTETQIKVEIHSDSNSEKDVNIPVSPVHRSENVKKTPTEIVMAKKVNRKDSSSSQRSTSPEGFDNAHLPLFRQPHQHANGSTSPYSFDSLPSSHANSPLPKHRLVDIASDNPSYRDSSDTDSLSRQSGTEYSGTESSLVQNPSQASSENDDYIVEEISKVRFRRMSKTSLMVSPNQSPTSTTPQLDQDWVGSGRGRDETKGTSDSKNNCAQRVEGFIQGEGQRLSVVPIITTVDMDEYVSLELKPLSATGEKPPESKCITSDLFQKQPLSENLEFSSKNVAPTYEISRDSVTVMDVTLLSCDSGTNESFNVLDESCFQRSRLFSTDHQKISETESFHFSPLTPLSGSKTETKPDMYKFSFFNESACIDESVDSLKIDIDKMQPSDDEEFDQVFLKSVTYLEEVELQEIQQTVDLDGVVKDNLDDHLNDFKSKIVSSGDPASFEKSLLWHFDDNTIRDDYIDLFGPQKEQITSQYKTPIGKRVSSESMDSDVLSVITEEAEPNDDHSGNGSPLEEKFENGNLFQSDKIKIIEAKESIPFGAIYDSPLPVKVNEEIWKGNRSDEDNSVISNQNEQTIKIVSNEKIIEPSKMSVTSDNMEPPLGTSEIICQSDSSSEPEKVIQTSIDQMSYTEDEDIQNDVMFNIQPSVVMNSESFPEDSIEISSEDKMIQSSNNELNGFVQLSYEVGIDKMESKENSDCITSYKTLPDGVDHGNNLIPTDGQCEEIGLQTEKTKIKPDIDDESITQTLVEDTGRDNLLDQTILVSVTKASAILDSVAMETTNVQASVEQSIEPSDSVRILESDELISVPETFQDKQDEQKGTEKSGSSITPSVCLQYESEKRIDQNFVETIDDLKSEKETMKNDKAFDPNSNIGHNKSHHFYTNDDTENAGDDGGVPSLSTSVDNDIVLNTLGTVGIDLIPAPPEFTDKDNIDIDSIANSADKSFETSPQRPDKIGEVDLNSDTVLLHSPRECILSDMSKEDYAQDCSTLIYMEGDLDLDETLITTNKQTKDQETSANNGAKPREKGKKSPISLKQEMSGDALVKHWLATEVLSNPENKGSKDSTAKQGTMGVSSITRSVSTSEPAPCNPENNQGAESDIPANISVEILRAKQQVDDQESGRGIPPKLSPRSGSEGSGSLEDSGHVSGASTQENTPEHHRTDSLQSQLSVPSTLSTVTDKDDEEDEADIDDLVARHKSHSGSRYGNLLSAIADSRESIVSYYSNAGEVDYGKIPITGEIQFGLDYNYRTGTLEIYIKQCKDIAPVDTKRNRSDPYVKTYLLPDKTRSGKRKTKVKKHTLNPTFEETLRYLISKSELENRTLWVTVWHSDKFGRNDFLGEVTINFDYFRFSDSSPKWYSLQERFESPSGPMLSYKGDLIISLRYVPHDRLMGDKRTSPMKKKLKKTSRMESGPAGELHVVIKEARNLTAVRSNGTSDPFCKGYLLPDKHRSSKQKTPIVKQNCNPMWNHTFIFEEVTISDLKERSLELTLWDFDKISSNDFLGGVRLNLGVGLSYGKQMDWMDARGEEISMWQAMLDRPNMWIDGSLILRSNMDKRKY